MKTFNTTNCDHSVRVTSLRQSTQFSNCVTALLVIIVTLAIAPIAVGATWPSGLANPLAGSNGGSVSLAFEGAFLDPDYNNGVSSSARREHVGQDLVKANGSYVYAIANGNVLWRYDGGKDTAIAVEHGSYVAVYGHIIPSTSVGATVTAGQRIGTVVDYGQSGSAGDHLHIGIIERVGLEAKAVLNKGWGKRPYGTSRSAVIAEGWRDPIPFLSGIGGGGDEAGSTISTSKLIPINATVPMQMTAGDVDVVAFDLPSSGTMAAYSSGSLDLVGTLLDSSGRTLATDDDSGSGYNFRITRSMSAGRYYLKVNGYRDRQVGAYGIGIDFQPASSGSASVVMMNGSSRVSSGSTLNLPTLRSGRAFSLRIVLANEGRAEARIRRVTVSSREITATGSIPSIIAPGRTATTNLRLTPTSRGTYVWTVTYEFEGGTSFVIRFRGTVN